MSGLDRIRSYSSGFVGVGRNGLNRRGHLIGSGGYTLQVLADLVGGLRDCAGLGGGLFRVGGNLLAGSGQFLARTGHMLRRFRDLLNHLVQAIFYSVERNAGFADLVFTRDLHVFDRKVLVCNFLNENEHSPEAAQDRAGDQKRDQKPYDDSGQGQTSDQSLALCHFRVLVPLDLLFLLLHDARKVVRRLVDRVQRRLFVADRKSTRFFISMFTVQRYFFVDDGMECVVAVLNRCQALLAFIRLHWAQVSRLHLATPVFRPRLVPASVAGL